MAKKDDETIENEIELKVSEALRHYVKPELVQIPLSPGTEGKDAGDPYERLSPGGNYTWGPS